MASGALGASARVTDAVGGPRPLVRLGLVVRRRAVRVGHCGPPRPRRCARAPAAAEHAAVAGGE
eukprot:10555719-Lingulodinium_polyedra.AAC.1